MTEKTSSREVQLRDTFQLKIMKLLNFIAFHGKILYSAKQYQGERREAHGKDINVDGTCLK